ANLHEVFGDLQVLGAGVVEQPLLGVQFRQFQRSIHARLQLGDLLVHGDALDREALRRIGIAHRLEALDGFGGVAQTRVEIADGVVDGKILGIVLQDLVVLSNGVLQLALLDKLFRGTKNLLFVKAKTKRHRERTPAFFPPNACVFRQRCPTGPNLAGRFPCETPQTAQPGSRSKVIVRPPTLSSMVTDDYRGLPKGSVRPVPEKNASRLHHGAATVPTRRAALWGNAHSKLGLNGGVPSVPARPPEISPCPLAFAGPALDCLYLRGRLPRRPFR